MNPWVEMVKEFHEKFGQGIRHKPTILPMLESHFRSTLIKEECLETTHALKAGNIVETADGIVDTIYVLIGTAIQSGIDLEPLFREVHKTNMAKVGGPTRIDGKILKPEGWEPPRIAELLDEQRRVGTYK
jgi:predicted HAD superfamily Cof-like phosphohydrolase